LILKILDKILKFLDFFIKKFHIVTAVQLAQLARQGTIFLSSVLLAKGGWSAHEIGIYETLFFIGGSACFFWVNASLQAMLSFYPRQKEAIQKSFFSNVFYLLIFLNGFSLLLIWWFRVPFLHFLAGNPDLPFFQIFSFFLFFNLSSLVLEAVLQLQNRAWGLLFYSWLGHGGQLLAVALPLLRGGSFASIFWGLLLVSVFRFLWCFWEIILCSKLKNNNLRIDFKIIQKFFLFALPLIGYAFLNGFATNFDAWLVNWFYGGDREIFSIFRYGAREFPLVMSLCIGLSNGMVPILARKVAVTEGGLPTLSAADLLELRRRTLRLWHWLFPLVIFIILIAKFLYIHILSSIFAPSAAVFQVYLLMILARGLLPQTVLLALGDSRASFAIAIVEAIANLSISFILIHFFGLVGVAFGTVCAFLLEKILIAVYLKVKYKISFSAYTDIKWFLFYSVILLNVYTWLR
jgi:O-antigen/teichoic acid export membrane protein